jgi:chemotaxis signal transduction protein
VQVVKYRCDVLIFSCKSDQTCGRIVESLKTVSELEWETIEKAIAIVKTRGYESMNETFSAGAI